MAPPHGAGRRRAPSIPPRARRSARSSSSRRHADGQARPANADHGRRRLEADGIRRELRDSSRYVRDDARDDAQHESEPAFGWRVQKAIETNLAVWPERQARVVVQRDADPAVAGRPQAVGFEDDLADLRRNRLAVTDDERRAGDN